MDLLKPSYATGYAKNASQSAHPNLWDGLVGAWMPSFGVTGETLRDVSGNGHHGTLTNMDAATDWVATSKGLALDFDGGTSSNHVSLGASDKIYENLTEATWVFWVKFNSFNYSYNQLLETYAPTNNYQISCLVKSNGKLAFYLSGVGGASNYDGTGLHTLASGKWYQLTYVYEGSKKQDGYVDARFDGRASNIRPSLISTTNEVFVSRSIYGGGRYIDGQYGSVIQYNRALSASEIKQLYVDSLAPFRTKKRTVVRVPAAIPAATKVGSIKKPTTIAKPSYQAGYARNASESENPQLWDGLVGAWMPSLGVTGETLRDVSGNGNHGTLTGMDAASDWVATSKGLALDFDKSNDIVIVNDPDGFFRRSGTDDLSVACWIYPTISGGYQDILTNRSQGNNFNYLLYRHTIGATIQLHGNTQNKSTYVAPSNKWTHIVATVRKNIYTLYANGEIVQGPISYNYWVASPTHLCFGAYYPSASEPYGGRLTDTSIYFRALSPSEIKQLYVDSLAPFRKKQRVSVAVPAGITFKPYWAKQSTQISGLLK